MYIKSVDFPVPLIDAQRKGSLVVFAGAGVSTPSPSNYPDFEGLVHDIATGSPIVREHREPFDQFLGRLQSNGTKVHELVHQRLSDPKSGPAKERDVCVPSFL
jgi:hypothetical protein